MDFTKEVLVFTHVPKTGGQSLNRALRAALGPERCVRLRMQKIENVRTSRLAELGVEAQVAGRRALALIRGGHHLLPVGYRGDLSSVAMFHGHIRVAEEPRTGRRPVYIAVVREPIDRFLSYFYYRRDQLPALMNAKGRKSHPLLNTKGEPPADPLEFLTLLVRSGSRGWRNAQCRYFSARGDFDSARRVIEERDVLVAPMRRLHEFSERISSDLGLPKLQLDHVNKGQSRAQAADISRDDAQTIAAHFAEDIKLYRYVEDRFASHSSSASAAQAKS